MIFTAVWDNLNRVRILESRSVNSFQRASNTRIVQHLLFWLTIFVFNALYLGYIEGNWGKTTYSFLVRFPFIVASCYFNLYYLLPKYYYTKRLPAYFSSTITIILLVNAVNLLLMNSLTTTDVCPKTYESISSFTATNYVYKLFSLFTIVGLTTGIKLSKYYLSQKQRIEATEKEKLATELTLLRSQMQPHFFFNTLNSLYALTLKKSDQAPEVVLKLSNLMSYVLYETGADYCSLKREVEHIKDYIDLESIRFGGKIQIDFEMIGVLEHKRIPHLLLIPFIENAFKHGTRNLSTNNKIEIKIAVQADTLWLQVTNPLSTGTVAGDKGGLGLKNVVRRLDLLYGSLYKLSITKEGQQHIVQLKIPLA